MIRPMRRVEDTPMIRVHSVRHSALATALLLVAGTALGQAAPASPGTSVKVKVMRVRASGVAAPGTTPDVDSSLGKLPVARLRGGHAKYVLEETIENPLTWGQALTMPVGSEKGDAGGRFEVVPVVAGAKGSLTMRIEEQMPAAKQPCLTVNSEVQAGRPHLFFCDIAIDGATILFFVTAELLAP
jgi:hypothetical protein